MSRSIVITNEQLKTIIDEKGNRLHRSHSIENIFEAPEKMKKSSLFEAYFATYPIDTVIKYLKKRYKNSFDIWKNEESNGEDVLYIRIPDDDENQKLIDEDMSLCGYYPSYTDKKEDNTRIITYEKRHQKTINNIVQEKGTIYHFTRRDKLKKIEKIGLCPKTNNKMFNYPERIYFFLEAPSYEDSRFFIKQLARYTEDHSLDYVLLEVDIEDFDIDFFYDPNLQDAVYTKENIPPERISIFYDKIHIWNNE